MIRQDFQAILLGFITMKIPMWLPEEAPEEMFLDIFTQRLKEHNKDIREILFKNGRDTVTMDSNT